MPGQMVCTPKLLPRHKWQSAAKIATEINPINHPPVEQLVRSTKVSPLSHRAWASRRWCALSFGGRPQLKLGRRRETPSATR